MHKEGHRLKKDSKGKCIFVTGTDTGVGKTIVSAAIACVLRKRSIETGVMKPVETGMGRDAEFLKKASGDDDPLSSIRLYSFPRPLSPWAAARAEGCRINTAYLERSILSKSKRFGVTIIEGAGGLMVPVTKNYTWLNLARNLSIPLIVVAANRLGVINHTVLTISSAKNAGIDTIGFIMNRPENTASGDPSSATNAKDIESITGVKCLGEMPRLSPDIISNISSEELGRKAECSLSIDFLLESLGNP